MCVSWKLRAVGSPSLLAAAVAAAFCLLPAASAAAGGKEWAVRVDRGGIDELAASHDLVVLGEALPGSGIYHVRQKATSSRRKRSADSVHASLASHPDVGWVEMQEVLSRQKRSEPDRGCFLSTVQTKKKGPKRCVFPFSYKGKRYSDCTTDHSTNGIAWCATEVHAGGEVVENKWGDCDPGSLLCRGSSAFVPQVLPPASPPHSALSSHHQMVQLPPQHFDRGFLHLLLGGRPEPPRAHVGLPPFLRIPLSGRMPASEEDVMGNILAPKLEDLKTQWNDPKWPEMWFLNRGYDPDTGFGLDMNVEEAWELNATGKQVVVTILDDGVEPEHPDLKDNYDPEASTDLNGGDANPSPRYDLFNSNKHGTRCAGQVSASANNSVCGVGIAFESRVGGVRVLDGPITDALEARALSHNRDHIDIYSASWGPDDDGRTVDGPGSLASMALRDGVEKGRGGKGSIFVWASGNGGKFSDNCNADGYTTSIYTLSVSSASENGNVPWYSEPCSSSMATTFSSGSFRRLGERKIITTDLRGKCTSQHTGTSASSPMAAGIVALALETNRNLTWRDVQHIVVRTSRPRGVLKADDWADNAANLSFSHSFGFGMMDAGTMVKLARRWKTVPEQRRCTASAAVPGGSLVERSSSFTLRLDPDHPCAEQIRHLEHVNLQIDLQSRAARGDLSVKLKSPGGTVSTLLGNRPADNGRTGLSLFRKWPLMSVHFWGEAVEGEWQLVVENKGQQGLATLNSWALTFYGTRDDPQPGAGVLDARQVDKDGKLVENKAASKK